MRKMWQKQLSAVGALLVMTAALSACGSTSSSGTTTPGGTGNDLLPEYHPTSNVVKMLTHDDGEDAVANQYLMEQYGLTIDKEIIPYTELLTALQSRVMSDDAPDLFPSEFYPSLIGNDVVDCVDDLIDFDSPLWSGVKENHKPFLWNGKNYYVSVNFPRYLMTWYNVELFEEAGLETPKELFEADSWDWNTMRDAAKALTIDADKDGEPEQYGVSFEEKELLLYTTGKHVVSYGPDGRGINNIRSPEVARCVNYMTNMSRQDNATYVGDLNGRDALLQGKVAILIGHMWYRYPFADAIDAGTVMFAPLPRDPDADKYYIGEEAQGYFIPKGAANREGAAAVLASARFMNVDEEVMAVKREAEVNGPGWNEECQQMAETINSMPNAVLKNWHAFDLGRYMNHLFVRPIETGEPWATIVEEIAPYIDEQIRLTYEGV